MTRPKREGKKIERWRESIRKSVLLLLSFLSSSAFFHINTHVQRRTSEEDLFFFLPTKGCMMKGKRGGKPSANTKICFVRISPISYLIDIQADDLSSTRWYFNRTMSCFSTRPISLSINKSSFFLIVLVVKNYTHSLSLFIGYDE